MPRVLASKEVRTGDKRQPLEELQVKYRVLIEQDEDGVFVAEVPSLPGCVTQGSTRGEALANAREAITGYLKSLAAHGEPIPPPIEEEVVEAGLAVEEFRRLL